MSAPRKVVKWKDRPLRQRVLMQAIFIPLGLLCIALRGIANVFEWIADSADDFRHSAIYHIAEWVIEKDSVA